MFYSHEILTSRKHGVATVWLVATLGAKTSSTKKVSRKAILEVNLKKACTTIMEPEAPMALRLQSNLLIGVSRVFDQQCHYVLQDAQAMQNAIRSLVKASRDNQLDAGAGKARPEQLLLLDDPAFMLEEGLPAINLDFESQISRGVRSSQSMMSVRGRSGSVSSSHAASVLGLNLPSSSGNSDYQLPNNNPFGLSSTHQDFGGRGREEEEQWIQDDDIFGFDEDGNIMESSKVQREDPGVGFMSAVHHPSDSAASGRVRKEHEDGQVVPLIAGENDYMMQFGDDDVGILPDDVEPFNALPLMTGGLGGGDQPHQHDSQDRVFSEEAPSSDSAQAPQVRKKRSTTKKKIAVDNELELKSGVLKIWQVGYSDRMRAANRLKEQMQSKKQAQKNAMHFVYGGGLIGVGQPTGVDDLLYPLAMFSGDSLLALVTGRSAIAELSKGKKRKSEEGHVSESKRHESEQGRASPREEIPVREDDDGYIMNMGDDDQSLSVELGRDAGSALPDHPSSAAIMPWNKSASLHSHQRNLSSQHGRGTLIGSGIGANHRLTSASPLIGRGSALPNDLSQLLPLDDEPMYGRADDYDDSGPGAGQISSSRGLNSALRSQVSQSNQDEFELFGRAANVDTQTAGTSQWVRDALDKESNNFLDYVRNTIAEKQIVEKVAESEHCVTFEELFNVEGNSHIVAAQAFYHVLCLATKRKVWVEQDVEVDHTTRDPLPFGEIRIGVVDPV